MLQGQQLGLVRESPTSRMSETPRGRAVVALARATTSLLEILARARIGAVVTLARARVAAGAVLARARIRRRWALGWGLPPS